MNVITRRRILMSLPFIGGIGIGASFYYKLSQNENGQLKVYSSHSPLKSIPSFHTIPCLSYPFFTQADLYHQPHALLINFFASWCPPCYSEIPFLRILSNYLPIWGIAYKDDASNIQRFLSKTNNPYQRLSLDKQGEAAIEWGIIGVPETFLIVPTGKIIYHWSQPMDNKITHNLIHLLAGNHVASNSLD